MFKSCASLLVIKSTSLRSKSLPTSGVVVDDDESFDFENRPLDDDDDDDCCGFLVCCCGCCCCFI